MSRPPAAGEETWLDRNRDECPRRNWRDADRPKPESDQSCVRCKADSVPISDDGWCPDCEPREGETCEDWNERTRQHTRGPK